MLEFHLQSTWLPTVEGIVLDMAVGVHLDLFFFHSYSLALG